MASKPHTEDPSAMIPAGYMAKVIASNSSWVSAAANVVDIYSVSNCASHDFTDYIQFWKHNGYWLFDTPDIIRQLARDNGIDLSSAKFFYYEVYPHQYDEKSKTWSPFSPETSFSTNVCCPEKSNLEGYDVVSFYVQTSPECSPLSCNNAAKNILVNTHCLLRTFEEAKSLLESGSFDETEPGPFRIFAVYSVPSIRS